MSCYYFQNCIIDTGSLEKAYRFRAILSSNSGAARSARQLTNGMRANVVLARNQTEKFILM